MAFIFAGIVALAAIALQVLVIFAEMSKPIPSSGFMSVFWPAVLGLPIAALIAASHFLHMSW